MSAPGSRREELTDDERHSGAETVELTSVPLRLGRELGDRALAEGSESETPKRLGSREIGEHAPQRMVATDLVPKRHDQHASREVQTAPGKGNEVERRGVCPLEVVDHGHHGRVGVSPGR